ncbi:ATP synthase F(0) complex subunit C1, mitochondrial-like [Aotus nancymaae]|uniref:ATP synthase F(0) complex subunit C1, mitochondrial-like n=1 Tax=Aotus nancymaae TaxID=37293 RepID=UPI0030FEF1EB
MQTPGALPISQGLIYCSTRGLLRSVSASSLNRPNNLSKQPSYSSAPLYVTRWEFQTCVVSWDIDTEAKFIDAGAPTIVTGSGAGIGMVIGHLIICSAMSPSLKEWLFYAILDFALSEAMGLLCLTVTFLIVFTM